MTARSESKPSETRQRSDAKKIRPGSFYSRHSFGTVVRSDPFRVHLKNADGLQWEISPDILEQEFSFADQYEVTEEVSRTKAIEVLTANSHTAMTLCFRKQVDPKAVAEALAAGQNGDAPRTWQAKVAEAIAGEQREMIGYHTNGWDEHRRLHFVETGKGPRLVDPRTLEWLIVGRVKYTVK